MRYTTTLALPRQPSHPRTATQPSHPHTAATSPQPSHPHHALPTSPQVKTEGDAFMVAFQEARDGLAFALEAQQRLFDAAWPHWLLDDAALTDTAGVSGDGAWRGLRVRIGLHTGKCLGEIDPTTKRMDYFGNMVNYSARIEGQAEGGEIVISDSTKAACDEAKLVRGVGW